MSRKTEWDRDKTNRKTEWDRVAKWKRDEIKWQRDLIDSMPALSSASSLATKAQANEVMVRKAIQEMDRIANLLRARMHVRGDGDGLLNESLVVGMVGYALLTADIDQRAKTALDSYNSQKAMDRFVDNIASHFPKNKK
jgi:hypothetical protein